MSKVVQQRFTIAGQAYVLTNKDVEDAARTLYPEPLRDHYVVIGRRRFPPKQLLAAVSGLDRADFTSHQARSIMHRLGFRTERARTRVRESAPAYNARGAYPEIDAEIEADRRMWDEVLPAYEGKWVLIKDFKVLFAHEDPLEVVAWTGRHDTSGGHMLRVPPPRGPNDLSEEILSDM